VVAYVLLLLLRKGVGHVMPQMLLVLVKVLVLENRTVLI
jgi:hypothetical protein